MMTATFGHAPSVPDEVRNEAGRNAFIDPLADSRWDRLVAGHESATLFHRSAWARVLQRTYGHRPFYLATSHAGAACSLVPMMEVRSAFTGRRGICVPFADLCEPLLQSPGYADAVFKELHSLAAQSGWRHVELRGAFPAPSAVPSVSYFAHTLPLQDGPDELFSTFEAPVRRAIRKAERMGLTVEIRTDWVAMEHFYHLHTRTRRKHGLPPQPLTFFHHIHEEIIEQDTGVVVLVSHADQPIAAAIFFHAGEQAIYKFGASDERALASRANNLAMWAGIRHCAARGCQSLHLGRTSRWQEGLRRYKLGWGASESTLAYFKYDVRAEAWTSDRDRAAGLHNAVFSRLPLPLNRLLGRFIYPHLA